MAKVVTSLVVGGCLVVVDDRGNILCLRYVGVPSDGTVEIGGGPYKFVEIPLPRDHSNG